jgi:hypothetical protein
MPHRLYAPIHYASIDRESRVTAFLAIIEIRNSVVARSLQLVILAIAVVVQML